MSVTSVSQVLCRRLVHRCTWDDLTGLHAAVHAVGSVSVCVCVCVPTARPMPMQKQHVRLGLRVACILAGPGIKAGQSLPTLASLNDGADLDDNPQLPWSS